MRETRRSAVAVAVLSFGYLLAYPLAIGRADESHLLLDAKRVLQGEVLYRDVFETLTPLGFHLVAAVYRLFGTTLLTARVLMSLIEAAGAALLFGLVRPRAGTAAAIALTLLFVGVCVPVWPIVSLHWMSTVLGILLASVVLAPGRVDGSRARAFVAGVIAGIAVCTQQQRGVFVAVWLPVGFLVLAGTLPRHGRWRMVLGQIAWAAAGGALVTGLVLGRAALAASPAAVFDQLVGFAFKHYGPTHSGGAWGEVVPFTEVNLRSTWYWLVRLSPLVLVVEGVALFARLRRRWTPADFERASLWLLAVMMLMSVLYLPDFIHVSFVLPFLLLPGTYLAEDLRARLPRLRRAAGGVVWLLALVVGLKAATNLALARELNPVRFTTAFGSVEGSKELHDLFEATRRHLHRAPGRRPVLYTYPDDAWLYLALDAVNPTRFAAMVVGFFPPEDVDEVVAVVRARRPDAVVLLYAATPPPVRPAVEQMYRAVEDVDRYRVYVRAAADPSVAGP